MIYLEGKRINIRDLIHNRRIINPNVNLFNSRGVTSNFHKYFLMLCKSHQIKLYQIEIKLLCRTNKDRNYNEDLVRFV